MRIMIVLTDKGFLKATKNSLSAHRAASHFLNYFFYLQQEENPPHFHAPIRSSVIFDTPSSSWRYERGLISLKGRRSQLFANTCHLFRTARAGSIAAFSKVPAEPLQALSQKRCQDLIGAPVI